MAWMNIDKCSHLAWDSCRMTYLQWGFHKCKSFYNCPMPTQNQPFLNRLKCTHISKISIYMIHPLNTNCTYIMTVCFCAMQCLAMFLRSCTHGILENWDSHGLLQLSTLDTNYTSEPTSLWKWCTIMAVNIVNPRHSNSWESLTTWKQCSLNSKGCYTQSQKTWLLCSLKTWDQYATWRISSCSLSWVRHSLLMCPGLSQQLHFMPLRPAEFCLYEALAP